MFNVILYLRLYRFLFFFFLLLHMKVATYNCRNFNSSREEITLLCENCDVIFLQETWLPKQDSHFLSSFSDDFLAHACHSFDLADGPLTGRPYGGSAVMWRKCLSLSSRCIDFHDDRIIGLSVYESCSNIT